MHPLGETLSNGQTGFSCGRNHHLAARGVVQILLDGHCIDNDAAVDFHGGVSYAQA